MHQIEKGHFRWDHKRKGQQFHWQWRLIFKLHTKKLFQEHLTCVNLVAPIIPYAGQREYLEIPLTEFTLQLFLSSLSLDFFHPFLIHFSFHVSDEELLLLPSPRPSLPLSAVSHFTWLFLLLHSPELNSVTASWQFPFAGDSGNWIWCLGELPSMMSQLCRKKIPYVIAWYTS